MAPLIPELTLPFDDEATVNDEVNSSSKSNYDIILGSDFLYDMKMELNYYREHIRWNDGDEFDLAPMKALGAVSDRETCNLLYTLNTASPILQEEEDRQAKILDADYSKVDIRSMVDELDISNETKQKLTTALAKFASTLFGGGLGKVDMKPIELEIKTMRSHTVADTTLCRRLMKHHSVKR